MTPTAPEPDPSPAEADEGPDAAFLPDLEATYRSEKRQGERHPCGPNVTCRVRLEPDAEFWTVRVHNLSARGVKLLLDRPVSSAAILGVELHHAQSQSSCGRTLQILYTFPDQNGRFIAGGVFDRELRPEELQKLF